MPLVQDIIASHAEGERVSAGEIVSVSVDRVYMQDGNTPTISRLFANEGFDSVFDRTKIGVFFDHSVLSPEIAMTDRIREAASFAARYGLCVFQAGQGISHVLALENGWFRPGDIVLGADSHTCTGGALQCLALGMGASDVVAAMVTGRTWLRVPETVVLETVGTPAAPTRAKDVMLYALSRYGQEPFLYRSLEWCGTWAEGLSGDGAATVANMAVEMGAKCAFLPPRVGAAELRPIDPDADGVVEHIRLDVTGLPPFVATPHSPFNARPLDELAGQAIDYVFVGSCANSRLEDLAEVARLLDTRQVRPGLHCVITPGSRDVYLAALRLGYIETFIRAGAVVTPPGCGSCVGTQGTIPATGDRVLSTMNRNFKGRMGNADAEIWLASPAVAAMTAIFGHIPHSADLS